MGEVLKKYCYDTWDTHIVNILNCNYYSDLHEKLIYSAIEEGIKIDYDELFLLACKTDQRWEYLQLINRKGKLVRETYVKGFNISCLSSNINARSISDRFVKLTEEELVYAFRYICKYAIPGDESSNSIRLLMKMGVTLDKYEDLYKEGFTVLCTNHSGRKRLGYKSSININTVKTLIKNGFTIDKYEEVFYSLLKNIDWERHELFDYLVRYYKKDKMIDIFNDLEDKDDSLLKYLIWCISD